MKCNNKWCECNGNPDYHRKEATRIQGELTNLGAGFAEDGIVKWVLRGRIKDEIELARG